MSTPYASAVGNPPVCTSANYKSWLLNYLNWRLSECPILTTAAGVAKTPIYFAQGGSDSTGSGTSASPYKSLAYAQQLMAAGNIMYFNPGDEWLETVTIVYPVSANYSSSTSTLAPTLVGFNGITTSDNWTLQIPGAQWPSTTATTTAGATTINVTSTASIIASGTNTSTSGSFLMQSANASTTWYVVTYTGSTSTTFTGCVGTPAGTYSSSALIYLNPNWSPNPIPGQYIATIGSTNEYGIITTVNLTTGALTVTNSTGANYGNHTHTALSMTMPRGLVLPAANITVAAGGATIGQRLPMFSGWGNRNSGEGGAASAYNFNNFTAPTVTSGSGPVVVTTGTSGTSFTTPFQLSVGDVIGVATSTNSNTGFGTVSAVSAPSGGVYTITLNPGFGSSISNGDTFNSPYQWTWTLQASNVDPHQIAWIRDRDNVSGGTLWRQMQTPDQVEATDNSWYQDSATAILYVNPGYRRGKQSTNIQPCYTNAMNGVGVQNYDGCRAHQINSTGYGLSQNQEYTFTVTGVTTYPTAGAVYTTSGPFTLTAISGGSGSVTFQGSGTMPLSGTLTKSSGTGDSTITYTNWLWTGNTTENQQEKPYAFKTNVGGTNATVFSECEATYNYSHNIGHTTSVSGGFCTVVNCRWGWGICGADCVGYAGSGGFELLVWGGYYFGGYLPQGIQPFSIIGSSPPVIGHTSFNSSATGSTGVAISSYTGSGTPTGTFTCATWASVNGQNTIGSYVQLTGGTSEYVLVTGVSGTSITVEAINGNNLNANHTAVSFGFWTAVANLFITYGITNEVNPFSSTGYVAPPESPSYYFPIYSGGSTASVYLTTDVANNVYPPATPFVAGEQLWAVGGTEEMVTVSSYNSTTSALVLNSTNGTTHTAFVSLSRCRAFIIGCQQLGWRQDKRVQATASYPITATSGSDTTISFANSYSPPANLAPQASQWIRLDGGSGLQPEWVQVKSYSAGTITLGDGSGILRTTKVKYAGRVTVTYDQSMASTTVGREQTCTYIGAPNSVCIGVYADVPINANTWENLTFFSSPVNMYNASTVDSSGTLHNGGGTTHINCIFVGDASSCPVNAGVQGFVAWESDSSHNSQWRDYNCRYHMLVGPRTVATIDSNAGAASSLNANKLGLYNSILSADYQGLSNLTAVNGGTEGGLSVGIGNTAQQQNANAYCNCNLNATLAAGTAGYTNDANAIVVPGCPPLWQAPEPGSPFAKVSNQTLIFGYPLQYDYYWNLRNPGSTAIGPIETVNPIAGTTPILLKL